MTTVSPTHTPSTPLPFAAALSLGDSSGDKGWFGALVLALLLHGAAGIYGVQTSFEIGDFASEVLSGTAARLRQTVEIESAPPPPEPEPPAEVEPSEPEPEPVAPPAAKLEAVSKAPVEAPPAAAEAGKVLTAEPDPDEPLDLTGTTFVTGSGEFRGGITAQDGTAKDAVYDRAAKSNGVVGGTNRGPVVSAPSGPDLTRSAGLRIKGKWDCPFPPEADIEQVDRAKVPVMVTIGPDGRAAAVQVLQDPGAGFGRAARNCALRQSYEPALNSSGKPITSTLGPLSIKFER